eukprot:UN30996
MAVPMGNGDDQDEDKFETALEEWMPPLWAGVGAKEPERKLLDPSYGLKVTSSAETKTRPASDVILPTGTTPLVMSKNMLLSPEGYERDIRHYEFEIKGTGVNYEVGDSLGVYANNPPELTQDFLQFYGLYPDDIIELEDKQKRKDPLPSVITAEQLFGQVLDMFGKPKRRFYEMMGICAEDAEERAALDHIISADGKDKYREYSNETMTHFDLLKQFQSAKPSVETLIDYIPRIKPRLYSIASSPNMDPDQIHLCVIVDDWQTPSGRYQKGLCSDYLTRNQEGQKLATRI